MRPRHTPALLVVSIVTLAACSGDGTSSPTASAGPVASATTATAATASATTEPTTPVPSTTETSETSETAPPTGASAASTEEMVETAVANLSKAYRKTDGVWAGFDTRDHPAVIVFKNSAGDHVATVAINHPAPDELGNAAEMAIPAESTIRSLHRITEPTDADYYAGLDAFDFHARLGGVDSFAMIAGGPDEFFDPAEPDWSSTWVHELFHRYQDEAFAPSNAGQDVEGYDFSPTNLRLAALEERALAAALRTDDADERLVASRHFVGLRLARLAADGRVALDESQERIEGTARFLEHRFAGDDTSFVYHGGNYDRDLDVGFDTGIKDHYGFGRFYGTGSAVLRLALHAGVDADELARRVEQGETPAEVLADAVGVIARDAAALVVDAEGAYDADDSLVEAARAAAARVPDEPPVFGDEESGDNAAGERDGEGIVLTSEDIACLEAQGVDLENDDIIPDEAFDACLAGTP